MSCSTPETIAEQVTFSGKMIALHTLIHEAQMKAKDAPDGRYVVEMAYCDLEYIRHLVECLTNIDTPGESAFFVDLVSCHPQLDYDKMAEYLK